MRFLRLSDSIMKPRLASNEAVSAIAKPLPKTIKKLKQGLMQQLVTRGIGHKKFKKVKWLFGKEIEIPKEWNYKKLENLVNLSLQTFFDLVEAQGLAPKSKANHTSGHIYFAYVIPTIAPMFFLSHIL